LALALLLVFLFQVGFSPVDNVPNLAIKGITSTGLALSGGLLLAASTLLAAVTVTVFLTSKDPIAMRSWIEAARAGYGAVHWNCSRPS